MDLPNVGFGDIPKDLVINEISKYYPRDWLYVSKEYYEKSFKRLLTDPRVDPTHGNCKPLRWAAKRGYVNVVRLLLQDPRVNINAYSGSAFNTACKHGHVDVVRFMMADPRFNPNKCDLGSFFVACTNQQTKVARLLLTDRRFGDPYDSRDELLADVCRYGLTEIVELLLADEMVPVTNLHSELGNSNPISLATMSGNVELVRRLINREDLGRRLNIPYDGADAVWWAIDENNDEIAKLLILHPEIQPAIDYQEIFSIVETKTSVDLIEIILGICKNIASADLMLAVLGNQYQQIHNILKSRNGVAQANDNCAINIAASRGQLQIVKLMAEYCFIDISRALICAYENSQDDVFMFLFKNLRTSEKTCTHLLYSAIYNPEFEEDSLIKLLLDDGRADPMYRDGINLYYAAKRGYLKIMKLLLADPRIRMDSLDASILGEVICNGDTDMLALILYDPRHHVNYDDLLEVVDDEKYNGTLLFVKIILAAKETVLDTNKMEID